MKAKILKTVKARNFPLVILIIVIILFFQYISNSTYLTLINIQTILNSTAIVALLAIGASFVIISGHIDLSAGYLGTFSGMLIAFFIVNIGLPWFLAFPLTLIAAMAVGFINATLIHKLGFQSFIATISMGSICEGLSFVLTGGKTITIKDAAFSSIGTSSIFKVIPSSVIFAVVALVVYGIILSMTKFGRKVYLVGGNHNAARLTGLNPVRVSYIVFMNNAAMSCVAGCLVASRVMAGTMGGITSQNFSGITASILGGISFGGGTGGVSGIIVGLLILSTFNNGLTVLRVESHWIQVASGILLLIALALDYLLSKSGNVLRKLRNKTA